VVAIDPRDKKAKLAPVLTNYFIHLLLTEIELEVLNRFFFLVGGIVSGFATIIHHA